MLWSVVSLLVMWRLLHVGLILAVPGALVCCAGWLAWRLWLRRQGTAVPAAPDMPSAGPPTQSGAVLPLVVGALVLVVNSAAAQDTQGIEMPRAVSIISANYTGRAGDKVASFDAHIQLTAGATNQTISFFGPEVAFQTFEAAGNARLVRDDKGVSLLLPERAKQAWI